jgi:very-short-patch-repair endonuclease/predicted transcriptional regulator of viral defense system
MAIWCGLVTGARSRCAHGTGTGKNGVGGLTVVVRSRFDAPPDLRVAAVAARQHGRIRVDQLIACGLDDPAIRRRVANGHLHRVHAGVYAVGHAGATLHAQIMAAVLAGGEGALASHWTSATLHGYTRWDGRRIDVTVPASGGRSRDGIRFHRPRRLDPRDVTRLHGIPTTTAARALLEIAPLLSDRRLKRAVRQAQAERATNVRQIADVLHRANGHEGTRRLAAVIASGPAPTVSGDEDVVLDLILDAGFAHPDVNRRLPVDHMTYVPDLRWPAQKLILEIDSAWHDGPLAKRLDAERQADLEAAGERVLRTTVEQAILAPHRLVRRLHAAAAPYTDRQP